MKNLLLKTNSNEVNNNDIFVCTTNEKIDRHNFIQQALDKKAKKVIVNKNKRIKRVKSTDNFLYKQLLKFYNHPERRIKIIGITGTDGKTTSALLIKDLLDNFIPCGYLGTNGFSYKNITKPTSNTTPKLETIIKCMSELDKQNIKYLVLEVSSEGLFYNRCHKLKFDRAILTNITKDHLNTHKNIDNYVDTKLKLFKSLTKKGIAILNKDDNYFQYFNNNITSKTITYGTNGNYSISNIITNENETTFNLKVNNKTYSIKSPLLGTFNAYNLCLSIALLNSLNIKIEDIIPYISLLKQPSGRLEFLNCNTKFRILIDYAHTINATNEVLKLLNSLKHNRIITIVGCAGGRDKSKRKDIGYIVNKLSDITIFTMDDPRDENINDIIKDMTSLIKNKKYLIINDRSLAIKKAIKIARKNDIIAILGKGNDNYMAINNQYLPYSDKEEVYKHIKKIH